MATRRKPGSKVITTKNGTHKRVHVKSSLVKKPK